MKCQHPRICSYLIHTVRCGYFDFNPRDKRFSTQRVDTVPKHAVKPEGELIGKNGVVLPIITRM